MLHFCSRTDGTLPFVHFDKKKTRRHLKEIFFSFLIINGEDKRQLLVRYCICFVVSFLC